MYLKFVYKLLVIAFFVFCHTNNLIPINMFHLYDKNIFMKCNFRYLTIKRDNGSQRELNDGHVKDEKPHYEVSIRSRQLPI